MDNGLGEFKSVFLESNKIKRDIENVSIEEFDKILQDCGMEAIKISIESECGKCLKASTVR